MNWLKKNRSFLISVVFAVMTLAVFGPLELYFTNASEFWLSLKDTAMVAALLAAFMLVVLLGIGLLLRGKAREVYSYILFAVTLALYIQGNYANISYGLLDGADVDWSKYHLYGILDTLGWIIFLAGFALLWFKKRSLARVAQRYAALFVIAIQVMTLGVLFFTCDTANTEKSEYYLSTDGEFELSKGHNIVIFVLDTFEETYFQQILAEESEKYEEMFSDFTHFTNAAVAAARTKAAMPAITTGMPYEGNTSYVDYISEAFNSDELYSKLKSKDYDVRFYTGSAFIPDDCSAYVDNQASTGYQVSSYTGLGTICASLTLYKYVPHLLKPLFWLNTADFDAYKKGATATAYKFADSVFLEGIRAGLSIEDSLKNAFRLYHLDGPHPPYVLNERAENTGEATDVIAQAKGSLYIVEQYIKQMKALGVYDDSTIIIMTDHGDTNEAYGLLLVKQQQPVIGFPASDAPVSYFDLHSTLFAEIGEHQGDSFFDIPEDESRVRYMNIYSSEHGTIVCTEYAINGYVGNQKNCKATGRVFRSEGKNAIYKFGTTLTFGAGTTASSFIVDGVSGTDEGAYSWTDGHSCEFAFKLASQAKKNLDVQIELVAVYDKAGPQRVQVYANDVMCCDTSLERAGLFSVVIPQDVANSKNVLSLRLELPDAVSPRALFGNGLDRRTLALAISGLTITETDEENELINWVKSTDASLIYAFGADGNARDYRLTGFYGAESSHTWASGYAEMYVMLPEVCDYTIQIKGTSHAASGGTAILLNGTEIAELNPGEGTEDIQVSKDILNSDGIQRLTFSTPDAVSPAAVGDGADKRVLGMVLYELAFTPRN